MNSSCLITIISFFIFLILMKILLCLLVVNPVDYVKTRIRYLLYIKYSNNPYLLYKNLRPRKPMDMRDWVRNAKKYLDFSDYEILTYDQLLKYLETFIKVSKRLILKDKQLLDLRSSALVTNEDVYEYIYKEFLKELNRELCLIFFYSQVRKNAGDFVSFLDKNKPSTIPPLEVCPENKIGYYACIENIKSHLNLV